MDDSELVDDLIARLSADDWRTAMHAADSLKRRLPELRNPDAVTALIGVTQQKRERAGLAINILGGIGDSSALPAILGHLASQDPSLDTASLASHDNWVGRKKHWEGIVDATLRLGGADVIPELKRIAQAEPAEFVVDVCDDFRFGDWHQESRANPKIAAIFDRIAVTAHR